jgi:hypothetical protein
MPQAENNSLRWHVEDEHFASRSPQRALAAGAPGAFVLVIADGLAVAFGGDSMNSVADVSISSLAIRFPRLPQQPVEGFGFPKRTATNLIVDRPFGVELAQLETSAVQHVEQTPRGHGW